MTDVDAEKTEAECEDAREAADMGEKPDLGHKADALIEALDGTDSGSDTRAEEAGLTSVMGMNQGDARAYGAAGGQAGATNLQVVAAPGAGGETSVQLSWSAGL